MHGNVLRNWEQFGLLSMHGQLVTNSGGYQALSHPEIHYGMSPLYMYPVYFMTLLFNWTGLGTLSYHILMALAVFWGAWVLLGKNYFAVVVAAILILVPGYMRWQKLLDPNAISIVPVIPYAAIILSFLRKPSLHPLLLATAFILTLAFMALNWTTVWVCGPCLILFWGMPGVNRRSLIWLVAVVLTSGTLIVIASFISKSGMHRNHESLSQIVAYMNGYFWSSSGYGQGLTTGRAFFFLAFTNTVALLPLWLAMAYAVFRCAWADVRVPWLVVLAPLGLTIIEIVIMRDYFGHHPWMASPVLLVGALFSLALLRALTPVGTFDEIPLAVVPAATLLCFLYGLAVLIFFRANALNSLSMVALVRENTPRSDDIVVVKSADPASAALANRFDEEVDRHVVLVDDFNGLAAEKVPYFILSSVSINGPFSLVAQKSVDDREWANRVADWFNHSIAHRRPGDRMELPDTYYLYQPKQ
jgi:hypothetical protein